jgi:hypothetical protein
MEGLIQWLVDLNNNNHLGFAALTVATMSGMGLIIGSSIELIFKALGIKSNKIEIHH